MQTPSNPRNTEDQSAAQRKHAKQLSDVTYATFGMDPKQYYEERFHFTETGIDFFSLPLYELSMDSAKLRCLTETLRS